MGPRRRRCQRPSSSIDSETDIETQFTKGNVTKAGGSDPFEDDDDPLRNVDALLGSSDLEADEGTNPHLSLPIAPSTVTVAENKAVVPPFQWPPLLNRSLMALTDAIFLEETRGRLAADDDLVHWRTTLLPLYCSIPRSVLVATIDGSLPHKHPWYLRNQSSEGYAIYVRWLVDAQGLAPTIKELLRIVDCLRNYVAGDVNDMKTAVAIDNVSLPGRSDVDALVRGEHYYLAGKEYRALLVYPLPKPPSYFGYAKTISKRQQIYKRN
ncbi:hypothetical protein J4E91_008140 [Alternaria rosae]|nr:hypothetical protein J4E91_008140 [Alternaria rosae]